MLAMLLLSVACHIGAGRWSLQRDTGKLEPIRSRLPAGGDGKNRVTVRDDPRGAGFVSLIENPDRTTARGRAMALPLAAFAEFGRENLREPIRPVWRCDYPGQTLLECPNRRRCRPSTWAASEPSGSPSGRSLSAWGLVNLRATDRHGER